MSDLRIWKVNTNIAVKLKICAILNMFIANGIVPNKKPIARIYQGLGAAEAVCQSFSLLLLW